MSPKRWTRRGFARAPCADPARVFPMRGSYSIATAASVAALLLPPGCSRRAPSPSLAADASDLVQLSVRVPAALSVARAIDTLSVAVDPASLGRMPVTAHAGTFIGVET